MLLKKLVLTALAVGLMVGTESLVRADDFQVTDDWTISITPARRNPNRIQQTYRVDPDVAGTPVGDNSPVGANQVNLADYQRVYESIPFSRSEYNVNPSYRHDSAMEILTGNARHQTVVRHTTPLAPPVISHQGNVPVNTQPAGNPGIAPTGIQPSRNYNTWRTNYSFLLPLWMQNLGN
ncbi:MAG: hypothetical protein KDA85_22335 [Planctomycetaceae bacterium]|nr:hypothetical protein [Planctomycetaceae bacterium]